MDVSRLKVILKCCFVPQRYLVVLMTSLALFQSFAVRKSFAIVLMTIVVHGNTSLFPNDTCPLPRGVKPAHTNTTFSWDGHTQELILISFYWGYILFQVPAGIVSELFGAKHVISGGILGSSILTIITPAALRSSKGHHGVAMTLRFFEGLFQGLLYPGVSSILAQWISPRYKSTVSGIVFGAAQLGIASAFMIGGEHIAWDTFMYLFGSLGLIWCLFWQLLCFSSPHSHPFVKDSEKEYLGAELVDRVQYKSKKIPFKEIFIDSHIWAAVVVEVGHKWCWYTIVQQLPKYMKEVMKFPIKDNAIWVAFPFFVMWVGSILYGLLGDYFINRGLMTVTTTRKIFTTIGYTIAGLFVVGASYAGCQWTPFIAIFVISLALDSSYNAGTKVICWDLSPNFAGYLMGIVNGFGSIVIIFSPLIAEFTTPHQVLFQWRNAFFVSFIVRGFTNLYFVICGSAKESTWNIKVSE